jgi:peptidoglycan/LPS O-acetylase OafA/YrhL
VAWVILILVLLAAAFGVLGAVIKATAFVILTVLLTLAVLAAIAWYGVRSQLRRWQREDGGSTPWIAAHRHDRGRDLPSHDDRY